MAMCDHREKGAIMNMISLMGMKIQDGYIILLILILLTACGCRIVKMGQFYLSENHQKPKQEKLSISNDPLNIFRFSSADKKYNEFIADISYTPYSRKKRERYKLSEYLNAKTRTTAFLVVRRDTILFEEYYEGFSQYSLLPSWSVAKSFTSALVGIAIHDGFLSSSDNVTMYFPELANASSYWSRLTVGHLLNMRSGIDFNEDNYTNPFSSIADLYMSKSFMELLRNLEFKYYPGANYNYSSLDTQILGLILERAIGMPLSEFLQDKIWKPLGMESNATWAVDGISTMSTKAFCCLDASLRDYARFARLYLKKGNWNGKQVIDSTWIAESIIPNFNNDCYQNQWYSQKSYHFSRDSLGNHHISIFADSSSAQEQVEMDLYQRPRRHWDRDGDWVILNCGPGFYALGIFGQEIYIDPEEEMIFIRLGEKWDTLNPNMFSLIRNKLKKLRAITQDDQGSHTGVISRGVTISWHPYKSYSMRMTMSLIFLVMGHLMSYAIKPEKEYKMRPSDLEITYEELRIRTMDGAELNTWVMEPNEEQANDITILIVGSDAGNMGYTVFYAKNLVDLGYRVISFDYRGFGDSTDFRYNPNNVYHSEYVTDFATVMNWVKKEIKTEQIGVFGLSMGTLIANLGYHQSAYDFFTGEAFLWSPTVSKRRILKLKNKELDLPGGSISDEELVARALVPTLLFAGKQDEITTVEDSEQFCDSRNDSQAVVFDGGHLRGIVALGVEEYFAAIDDFIKNI